MLWDLGRIRMVSWSRRWNWALGDLGSRLCFATAFLPACASIPLLYNDDETSPPLRCVVRIDMLMNVRCFDVGVRRATSLSGQLAGPASSLALTWYFFHHGPGNRKVARLLMGNTFYWTTCMVGVDGEFLPLARLNHFESGVEKLECCCSWQTCSLVKASRSSGMTACDSSLAPNSSGGKLKQNRNAVKVAEMVWPSSLLLLNVFFQ